MIWDKDFIELKQYECVSTNQHGDRYKKKLDKSVSVVKLSCKFDNMRDNIEDLRMLIVLGHWLNVPVRYDFDSTPQKAYIEVVSREALEGVN